MPFLVCIFEDRNYNFYFILLSLFYLFEYYLYLHIILYNRLCQIYYIGSAFYSLISIHHSLIITLDALRLPLYCSALCSLRFALFYLLLTLDSCLSALNFMLHVPVYQSLILFVASCGNIEHISNLFFMPFLVRVTKIGSQGQVYPFIWTVALVLTIKIYSVSLRKNSIRRYLDH